MSRAPFSTIAAAAAAKIESGVAGGACPGSVSAPGDVRRPARVRDCSGAVGFAARPAKRGRGATAPQAEGEAPAVERSGTSAGARGGTRHKKAPRVLRCRIREPASKKLRGRRAGGSFLRGLICDPVRRSTGKDASRLPAASDRPGRLRRQGHNGGLANF